MSSNNSNQPPYMSASGSRQGSIYTCVDSRKQAIDSFVAARKESIDAFVTARTQPSQQFSSPLASKTTTSANGTGNTYAANSAGSQASTTAASVPRPKYRTAMCESQGRCCCGDVQVQIWREQTGNDDSCESGAW